MYVVAQNYNFKRTSSNRTKKYSGGALQKKHSRLKPIAALKIMQISARRNISPT
jgi:hypothetical protein